MRDRAKRNLGGWLGLAMGLVYGIVSQYVNSIFLADIPFYIPLPSRVVTILLFAICGMIAGRFAAWSPDRLRNMALSAVSGAVLSTVISLWVVAAGAHNQAGVFRLIFVYFIPRGVVFLGIAWMIAWVIKVWESELRTIHFSVIKLAMPILPLLVVSFILGLLAIYPKEGRNALNKTKQLIESGLSAGSYAQLPPVLLPVNGFLEKSEEEYTLQLSDNPAALPIQLPISGESSRGHAVIVRFKNGFRFACAFATSNPEPACGEY